MYDCVYFADCWTALEHGITPSVRSRTQERACVRSLRRGRENLIGRIGMTHIRLCSRKLLQKLPKIHLVRHRKKGSPDMWDLLDRCFAGRVCGCGIKDCFSLNMLASGQRRQLQGITLTLRKRYKHGNHNTPETILDESVIGNSSF